MKKIEQDIIEAIREKRNFKSSYIKARESMYYDYPEGRRDQVIWLNDSFKVLLWDNEIARADTVSRKLTVSGCGYSTQTTTSRLNAVFAGLNIPMSAVIRKGELKYTLNGEVISENVITACGWNITVL